MPVESAAGGNASNAEAAAGPDIGTAFPGEYTSDIADGVTSMAVLLESKVASLKETLVGVVGGLGRQRGGTARLERTWPRVAGETAAMRPCRLGRPRRRRRRAGRPPQGSAFGSGTREPSAVGNRPSSGTVTTRTRTTPTARTTDDDDDDDGDDNEGTAEGARSPLAKAAAATPGHAVLADGRGAHRRRARRAAAQRTLSDLVGATRPVARERGLRRWTRTDNSDGDDGAPREPRPRR